MSADATLDTIFKEFICIDDDVICKKVVTDKEIIAIVQIQNDSDHDDNDGIGDQDNINLPEPTTTSVPPKLGFNQN